MPTLAATILLRNDTSSNWSSANPVLAAGEVGLDTTSNRMKVGDGATAWNSLPFSGGAVDVVSNVATSRILGRVTAGSGDSEELTAAQVRTLLNVADGATANASDAALRDRATHTGTQAISTVTGLQTALDGKQALITSNVQTLGADVNMPSSTTWYDAVSYTPAAGTWLFFGQIAFRRAATTARQYSTRIYDGTNAITGADMYVPSVNPSRAPLFCVGIATTDGTKTYTLQGQTTVGDANEFIRKDLSPGGDVATQLVSIKIG